MLFCNSVRLLTVTKLGDYKSKVVKMYMSKHKLVNNAV